jgi:hypothetical protein
VRVTPVGSVPVKENVGAGNPVATTWKELFVPVWKVSLSALVMAGAAFTVSVKL